MGRETAVINYVDLSSNQHPRVLANDNAGRPTQITDTQSGVSQWFASDGRGSVGDVTNADGSSGCVVMYDTYGSSVFGQGATNACIASGSQLTELGYHFTQRDATTGDYTFGLRAYDPSKSAFTTPDSFTPGSTRQDVSIGSDPLTEDRYSYVNGDPINRIDPTGHMFTTGDDQQDNQGPCNVCMDYPTSGNTGSGPGGCGECGASAQGPPPSAYPKPPPSLSPVMETHASQEATLSDPSGLLHPGPGQWADCVLENDGSVICPDSFGDYTLTPNEYPPHGKVDWIAGLDATSNAIAVANMVDGGGEVGLGVKAFIRWVAKALAKDGAESAAGKGWRVGEDIYVATRAGDSPAWSTVRSRFWKNVAADKDSAALWGEGNLDRMRNGLAPQRYNPQLGGMESMELSHEPVPFRDGGTNIVPRWPQDHAAVDPYRFPGY
jgi:RHS repeat-associated protein